jgi:hypothetical protein
MAADSSLPDRRRGRPQTPDGARSSKDRQRAYRERLKAAGKVLRVIDADAMTAADANALRMKLQLREQDVARLTARNHYLENELRRVEQYNLNILKEIIGLRQAKDQSDRARKGRYSGRTRA